MTVVPSHPSGSALRERMIEDMSLHGRDRQIADPDTDCIMDRIGDRSRNAGGAEFADAASAGRACMRVQFVDDAPECRLEHLRSRAGKRPSGSSTAAPT